MITEPILELIEDNRVESGKLLVPRKDFLGCDVVAIVEVATRAQILNYDIPGGALCPFNPSYFR